MARPDHGLLAIFFDLGDTLMIEETEVKDGEGTTLRADLIPGVAALLRDLHTEGVPLALVADSRPNTPPNVLRQHDLLDLFSAVAISDVVGVSKPDPGIFRVALDALSIPEAFYDHVAMVGNNLERDVVGANRLGLISVYFQWNGRRRTEPRTTDEIPDFTVHTVAELRNVLFGLDRMVRPAPIVTEASTIVSTAEPHKIEIVCHKGANAVAPENTYAAARQCIDWGADTVEIDVWTSRDGEMVLLHDATVDRTTDGAGHALALTADELGRLDAGSWFHPSFRDERIPKLAEFLRWVKGKAKVFIDVKFAHPQQLIDLLYATGMEKDCFLWSGSDELMQLFHELDPEIPLKVNVSAPEDVIAAQHELDAQIVEVSLEDMSETLVQTCRERGVKLMIYEKDPKRYPEVIAWQPDMVNLDYADQFLGTLARLNVETSERANVSTYKRANVESHARRKDRT